MTSALEFGADFPNVNVVALSADLRKAKSLLFQQNIEQSFQSPTLVNFLPIYFDRYPKDNFVGRR
jgi:hypothetical protein